ncbi:hypothetical protein BM525_19305 (plasmid) [Alteromonas mediterranea]|uniref:Uncharacterized protein n=1 Tax=Alteromonas mediterranea TaxID=314275 RepID=A0AAC9JHF2_9ALTE|nr:hypothetical protein [Alteromonas mediterranea]APD92032.1 hypothetical protein BM524_19110 [Alteromonas mediterranea]APD99886.1 hypothetical protein BM525_19305 [Alteromonas mediterranea]
MSWSLRTESTPRARKTYQCDACEWLVNVGTDDLSEDELSLYEQAKSENFSVQPGQTYVKVEGIWDGEFTVFRARPEINAICTKHKLYDC